MSGVRHQIPGTQHTVSVLIPGTKHATSVLISRAKDTLQSVSTDPWYKTTLSEPDMAQRARSKMAEPGTESCGPVNMYGEPLEFAAE
eukprot:3156135-Rhodomonas_salina.4